MINERDGGINGVKLLVEECETGYATDKGVECYERLKGKGPTGAAFFNPLSTGITFALTEKTQADKIPIITMGYGRADSKNGSVFSYNFPLLGTYWSAADIAVQHVAKELGGMDKLKGKKISLVYHDSPYGKEPIPALQALAAKHGFEFKPIPVTHPGVEQKSQWLSIRQDKPDYVLLWGWGVMNGTAVKEAAAVAYPRDKMIGVWWSGAEPDVTPAGDDAKGYKALMLQHGAGKFKVHADIQKLVLDKGKGLAKEDFGQVLYNRGVVNAMLGVEAIRKAQEKFGKKPLTGEQVRWGLREPQPVRCAHQGAGLRRHAEAGQDLLLGPRRARDQAACSSGTARSGRSSPTGTPPTRRSSRAARQGRVGEVRHRQEDRAARLLQGELSPTLVLTPCAGGGAAASRIRTPQECFCP